jgi:PAS domain S-box-containing protein
VKIEGPILDVSLTGDFVRSFDQAGPASAMPDALSLVDILDTSHPGEFVHAFDPADFANALPDALCLVDAGGHIRLANDACCALLGYTHQQMLGLLVEDLLPERLRSGHARLRQGFVAESRMRRMGDSRPLSVRCADGSELQVEISIGLPNVSLDGGQLTAITLIDRSARVKAEAEVQRLTAELEQRVLSRTTDLMLARAEAESANAVKTHLMANLSHEMRTPLQGILGFAEIGKRRLSKGSLEDAESYFERILDSGLRMHKLVESLLTLVEQSRAEHAGVAAESLESISPEAFAGESVHLMALTAETRQQQIQLEIACDITQLTGDAARLRQVLECLLGNALRYSPSGATVILRLEAAMLPVSHTREMVPAIAFQVIDEGCGVPETELAAIFEPFYQSSRTASGAGGTGLGLPLSRSIVNRHGGQLSARNRPEGGSIFEMRLPLIPLSPPLAADKPYDYVI